MGLVFKRKVAEGFVLRKDKEILAEVTITYAERGTAKIKITCPDEIHIMRSEIAYLPRSERAKVERD